ncbi:uncharacterized protein [Montipora foliosa]|uniref:uncharacterized protein n=1 Tax=Montipora foliosa TaxID=591990 RepID=UPI0035F11B29
MELRRRLPFPEEQAKTRAQILISAAEYVDALERRICQMQDSQLGEGGNIEEEVRMSLPGCRFSTGQLGSSYFYPSPERKPFPPLCWEFANEFHKTEMQRDLMSPTSLSPSFTPTYPDVSIWCNCCGPSKREGK